MMVAGCTGTAFIARHIPYKPYLSQVIHLLEKLVAFSRSVQY